MAIMKTIDDVRAQRLADLIAEAGGPSKFAKKILRSPGQVTQWTSRSPDSKTGKPRTISTEMCRYIESKCDKPMGWMDRDDVQPETAPPLANAEVQNMVELMTLYASVPEPLRPRVFQAVRGVIINLGGVDRGEGSAGNESQ